MLAEGKTWESGDRTGWTSVRIAAASLDGQRSAQKGGSRTAVGIRVLVIVFSLSTINRPSELSLG